MARILKRRTTIIGIAMLFALSYAALIVQSQDENSRQIVLDRFNQARPAANHPVSGKPVYRRTGSLRKSIAKVGDDIGITVWRLRPWQTGDSGAQVLVLDGLKQAEWAAERIEADTLLRVGDRIRISVEAPRSAYLYIIDREQYADGSLGEPMLIFPTLNTRRGDNRVLPGRLIDIPAQEDQYSYFTAQPSGDRRDQVAEVLTIILLPKPLPLQLTQKPLPLTPQQIAGWEKVWGGTVERLELVGGAGKTWTTEEKEAGAANGRQLTQAGPPPQTVYRVARRTGGSLLVTVPLSYAK